MYCTCKVVHVHVPLRIHWCRCGGLVHTSHVTGHVDKHTRPSMPLAKACQCLANASSNVAALENLTFDADTELRIGKAGGIEARSLTMTRRGQRRRSQRQ